METVMRDDLRDGLAAAKTRRRRLQLIIGGLMGAGAVLGFFSAKFEMDGGGFMQGIPAGWAIVASVILLVALGFGGWRYNLATDELDRRDNQWASAMALNFYISGYACWYLWWRGGLVPEPQHQTIFVATMAAMLLAYGYKKLRP
jgi:hypothetical protein